MSTQRIAPSFWFDDQAEAAAAVYTQLFGGRTTAVAHYPEGGANRSGKPPGSMTALLASPDQAGRERAFAALMTMGKLDLAVLEAAFAGR